MKLSKLTEAQRAEYDLLLDKKRRLLKEIKNPGSDISKWKEKFQAVNDIVVAQHEMNHIRYPKLDESCNCGYKRP
jgi:hypothetical protein